MSSMTRWIGVAGVVGALGLGAALLWPEAAPDSGSVPVERVDPRPNVLIVLWDTVRADHMSLYGHHRPTTPALEAFAERARVYENATAPAMWTLPTHATFFTGRYPTTHGARAGYRWLDHHHDTLAELLLEGGYETFLFSSNLIAGPLTNLHQGFGTVRTTYPRNHTRPGPDAAAADRMTHAKLIDRDASTEISPAFTGRVDAMHWDKAVYKDAAPLIVEGLLDWLEVRDEPQRPWFAYVNMMEAHTPRVPSMTSREALLTPEQIELGLQTDLSLFAENEYIIGQRTYTDAQLEAIGGVYDAALLDLDTATAKLFAGLEARGELDDTLVIVMSDHGEHLGEHQRFEHRWSMHQELLHVPLVIRYPAEVAAGRVSERVTTADVFSTVLDVAGVEAPEGTQTRSLLEPAPEHVFAQLLDPFASQLHNVREVYDEAEVDYSAVLRTGCAAFGGADKYLHWSTEQHELFDLEADPGESRDLLGAEPERALALARALFTWEQALPLYDPGLQSRADRRSRARRHSKVEERNLLAMLGYTEEEDSTIRPRCGPEAMP